jgi:uncharacterized protein (TIGR03792 family)
MVIEWLKFRLDPQIREKFIEKDREIWTAALSLSPGYLGKEIWLDPNRDDEVILVVKWANREAWGLVPPDLLANTESEFEAAMGGDRYEMIEEGEFQVRKFPL